MYFAYVVVFVGGNILQNLWINFNQTLLLFTIIVFLHGQTKCSEIRMLLIAATEWLMSTDYEIKLLNMHSLETVHHSERDTAMTKVNPFQFTVLCGERHAVRFFYIS